MANKDDHKAETSVQTLTHSTGAANNGGEKQTGKEVFVSHVQGSKAQRAQEVFNKIGGTAPRKEVIRQFVEDIGLSVSGASTYYQNMKAKAGLVKPRVLVTTQVTGIPVSEAGASNTGTRGNDMEKGGTKQYEAPSGRK